MHARQQLEAVWATTAAGSLLRRYWHPGESAILRGHGSQDVKCCRVAIQPGSLLLLTVAVDSGRRMFVSNYSKRTYDSQDATKHRELPGQSQLVGSHSLVSAGLFVSRGKERGTHSIGAKITWLVFGENTRTIERRTRSMFLDDDSLFH